MNSNFIYGFNKTAAKTFPSIFHALKSSEKMTVKSIPEWKSGIRKGQEALKAQPNPMRNYLSNLNKPQATPVSPYPQNRLHNADPMAQYKSVQMDKPSTPVRRRSKLIFQD